LLPRIFSGCKRFVVNPSAQFKRVAQFCSLAFGWIKALFEGQAHTPFISLFYESICALYLPHNWGRVTALFYKMALFLPQEGRIF